jgi:hypothetical protein
MSVVRLGDRLLETTTPGMGYIAGEPPDGLVTKENVPSRANVDLLVRSTHQWIRRTISKDDGTYRFGGLSLDVEYDVIGQDISGAFGDVIVSRVRPYAPPQITTSLIAMQVGMPPAIAMEAQYGTAPLAWSAVGLPPGVSLRADGVFEGLPTTAGTFPATILVEDAHGSSTPRDYAIVVTS